MRCGPKGELGKAVDQVRVAEPQPQNAALRAIKARTGNGNTVVEVMYKMFNKMGAAAADIGLGNAVVQLGLGNEGL